MRGDRPRPDLPQPHVEQRERHALVPPGILPKRFGVDLQFDESANAFDGIAKQEPRPFNRPEEVAHHRELAAFDPRKIDRRAACLVDAALDLGRFQAGIDFDVQPNELPGPFQIIHALTK